MGVGWGAGCLLCNLASPGSMRRFLTATGHAVLQAWPCSPRSLPAGLQAKDCFSLLPDSAAAREQLAGIAAAEQLQRLGLDLPPLQLQQLHAEASAGDTRALEQLLAEHPKLLAADSTTLGQLAAALGLERQQQALLLRAATAAHAAGELARAQGLLQLLVEHQYRWAGAGVAGAPSGPPLVLMQRWCCMSTSALLAGCWEKRLPGRG